MLPGMRSTSLLLIGAATLIAACSGGAATQPASSTAPATADTASPPADPAPPATASRTRKLTADETLVARSGASLLASSGWTVEESTDRIVLTSPEGDVAMAYVEVTAADREAAVAAAWARWKPGFALKVERAQDLPARDGWDAIAQVSYVTPVQDSRLVLAIARRAAGTWYVFLVDGTQAAVDRRGAHLSAALDSLAVPGLAKESFAGKVAHPLDAARLAELERFIEDARVATKVPGTAIAIVQGGKVIYEKGFGVRQVGKPAKVTPRTLFMIGSVGKSLTTLMIARLVEQGRIGWETPVVEVLPSFGLGDEATTKAVTMRHTACACTGMPRQDLEMLFEGRLSPEERLASMKAMKPTTKFGETYQYSNLMVSAGGFAAAHAHAPALPLGKAYDRAMKQLVFAPLGMSSTTFDFAQVARSEHAVPHPRDLRGDPTPSPLRDEEWVLAVRPAGGTWSSVHDMARVLLLELGRGKLDGKQVIDERVLLARRAPQVKISSDESYGLGLAVGTEAGIPLVSHSGGTAGFTTRFVFLPEHDVGMVLVSNASRSGLFYGVVERRLLELLFDGRARAKDDLEQAVARRAKETAEELAMVELDPPAAWFAGLAGTWTAPGLGRIELRVERGKPILDAGEWKVAVGKKTARDGTVMLVSTAGFFAGFELVPREQDGRTVLVLDAGQQKVEFERVAPPGKR